MRHKRVPRMVILVLLMLITILLFTSRIESSGQYTNCSNQHIKIDTSNDNNTVKNETNIIESELAASVDNHDDSVFWTKLSAIGTLSGAFATTGAVIVALWQTRFNQRKKLKVRFTDDVGIVLHGSGQVYKYIGLDITNIGNRSVTIDSWGYKLINNGKMLLLSCLSPDNRPFSVNQPHICVNLPYKIEIEESAALRIEKGTFISILTKNVKEKELNKNENLVFFVCDNTGKEYTVKTNRAIANYIKPL